MKGSAAFLTTGLSNENGPIFVVRETIKGLKNFKISIKSQKKTFEIEKINPQLFFPIVPFSVDVGHVIAGQLRIVEHEALSLSG